MQQHTSANVEDNRKTKYGLTIPHPAPVLTVYSIAKM
ncbi:hypothetical protein B0I21_109128 [Sphingobacterium paludis]|uniref:Uncharacterized protein n=1 Tax=Sphingobacterium paludis TaxID=1476465 RepID=A0A4R7CU71_9SPHI|nr:hypothetical protein B0I21_109128 [Sphingobacterium paludis]